MGSTDSTRRVNVERRGGVTLLAACICLAAVLGASCAGEEPVDDLDYLVWEVCRQVRSDGLTAGEVSGILHDATRHGPVMDDIDQECGDEIAAVYATESNDLVASER